MTKLVVFIMKSGTSLFTGTYFVANKKMLILFYLSETLVTRRPSNKAVSNM